MLSRNAINFAPLCVWYRENARALPWRADAEPYHVWVSEIMLQQTRIETVIPYYERFLAELPTVECLAACPEDRLLKLWEGLGYYSRARNLHRAAKQIVSDYGGVFPRETARIRALPGVGEYTAGAIASICFGLPEPAVDGNVLRIIARLLELRDPVTDSQTKREITESLRLVYIVDCMGGRAGKRAAADHRGDASIPKIVTNEPSPCHKPGVLTQALMELGETVCLPGAAPRCDLCPLRAQCHASKNNTAGELPLRARPKEKREVEITVLLLTARSEGADASESAEAAGTSGAKAANAIETTEASEGTKRIAIRRRPDTGLLAGLWELPNTEGALTQRQAFAFAESLGARPVSIRKGPAQTHIFTHIKWKMRSYRIECEAPAKTNEPKGGRGAETPTRKAKSDTQPPVSPLLWTTPEALLRDHALPTAFRKLLV